MFISMRMYMCMYIYIHTIFSAAAPRTYPVIAFLFLAFPFSLSSPTITAGQFTRLCHASCVHTHSIHTILQVTTHYTCTDTIYV